LQELPSPDIQPSVFEDKTLYLACGELKGGIDPAGADEHWKTAGSALARIRSRCGRRCPRLFFAASAIEEAMAKEIYHQLRIGKLSHAANLTVTKQ
jgi:type II restriction enzyme